MSINLQSNAFNSPKSNQSSLSPNLSRAKASSTISDQSKLNGNVRFNSNDLSILNTPAFLSVTNARRLPEIIEIGSEREANIRNYEIEQFRNDEIDLKEQFNDLLQKMDALQRTLNDLEARELEEVQQKKQEAESFERETREKIEHLKVQKEEIDREAYRLDNRLKELRNLKREATVNKNLNGKMQNEMGKCLRKLR